MAPCLPHLDSRAKNSHCPVSFTWVRASIGGAAFWALLVPSHWVAGSRGSRKAGFHVCFLRMSLAHLSDHQLPKISPARFGGGWRVGGVPGLAAPALPPKEKGHRDKCPPSLACALSQQLQLPLSRPVMAAALVPRTLWLPVSRGLGALSSGNPSLQLPGEPPVPGQALDLLGSRPLSQPVPSLTLLSLSSIARDSAGLAGAQTHSA